MIPKIEDLNIGQEIKIIKQPNLTYGLDGKKKDGLEAVKQAIYKILQTERYQYEIYNWNYGIEIADLFGKPVPFVQSELKRRIKEALLVDDRITDVTDFAFQNPQKRTIAARFVVHTIFGDIEAAKEVAV